MSDEQHWQAPGSVTPPPPPGPVPPQPPTASVPPAMPQPLPQGSPLPPPAAGWTAPVKPGLVPLRPLTLGVLLGAAFQTLRRNPAILAPALLLSLAVALLQALGSAGFLTQYFGAISDLSDSTVDDTSLSATTDSLTSGLIGVLITSLGAGVLSLVITAIVQGFVTLQVASSTLGSRLRLGALWRRMRGRRGALIGWAAISGSAAALAVIVVIGLLVLVGISGPAGIVIAVLLGFLLGAGLLVVFVWLWVKLGFVPVALVLERSSIRRSMARSWSLTRHGFWRIFGIRLLVAAMLWVATQIITGPISLIFSLGGGVLQPNGETDAAAGDSVVLSVIVIQAVTAVLTAVGLVVATATTSLLYLDQRIRLEGLDLDLARFVERRQAGEQDLGDPFAGPAGPPFAPSPAPSPSGAV